MRSGSCRDWPVRAVYPAGFFLFWPPGRYGSCCRTGSSWALFYRSCSAEIAYASVLMSPPICCRWPESEYGCHPDACPGWKRSSRSPSTMHRICWQPQWSLPIYSCCSVGSVYVYPVAPDAHPVDLWRAWFAYPLYLVRTGVIVALTAAPAVLLKSVLLCWLRRVWGVQYAIGFCCST